MQQFKQLGFDGVFGRTGLGRFARLGRAVGQNDIELFALKGLADRLGNLLLCKVRQKVGNAEHGLAGFFANGHGHGFAVFTHDNAVQGQGPCQPLIFADAAVIVCFGLGHAGLFNKRALLEIQTRRVGVGGQQREALAQG